MEKNLPVIGQGHGCLAGFGIPPDGDRRRPPLPEAADFPGAGGAQLLVSAITRNYWSRLLFRTGLLFRTINSSSIPRQQPPAKAAADVANLDGGAEPEITKHLSVRMVGWAPLRIGTEDTEQWC